MALSVNTLAVNQIQSLSNGRLAIKDGLRISKPGIEWALTVNPANEALVIAKGGKNCMVVNDTTERIRLTAQWEAYGDMLTSSVANGTADDTWCARLATALGTTCTNLAADVNNTSDTIPAVFNNHVDGRSTVFLSGLQDVRFQADGVYDQLLRTLESLALWCCLPAAKLTSTRSAAVTKVGSWSNTTAYNIGMRAHATNAPGAAYLEATVSGRFVVWAGACNVSAGEKLRVEIDGVVVSAAFQNNNTNVATSPGGRNFTHRACVYDTGSTGAHTLRITYLKDPGADAGFVDYVGAFDDGLGCSSVVFVGLPPWNYRRDTVGTNQTEARRQAWNAGLQEMCRRLEAIYGLPVYYADPLGYGAGELADDGIRPSLNGHRYLANRVLRVLNTPELEGSGGTRPLVTLTPTWEAYGDSITANLYNFTTADLWANQVAAATGTVCTNFAIGGNHSIDTTPQVFNNHVDGRSSVFFIGTNDIRQQADTVYDQLLQTLESLILWNCLPAARVLNARSAAVTKVGAWSNTSAYNIGMGSNISNAANAAYIEATVTGRYVVWSTACSNERFRVELDGAVVNASFLTNRNVVRGRLINFVNRACIYDTGVSGPHTLRITYLKDPGTDLAYVDYIGAFDGGAGCADVVVLGVPMWNYRRDGAPNQTEPRRQAWNTGLKEMCQRLKQMYGLPVHYIDSLGYTAGQLHDDGLHANKDGQRFLRDRVMSVLRV